MSKFKKGDEVRFTEGSHKGRVGVVYDPHWQISQSDWPEVKVDLGADFGWAFEEYLELAEDLYEYGATWASPFVGEPYFEIFENEWGTLEEARQSGREAESVGNTGIKIMRRLKAGEPEDWECKGEEQ